MNWNHLAVNVAVSVAPVAMAALTWLIKRLGDAVALQASHIRSRTLRHDVEDVLVHAEGLVDTVVVAVEQTFVKTMKKAGKWDEAAMAEAKKLALEQVRGLLTGQQMAVLRKAIGNVETYLSDLIERRVFEL